MSHQLEKGSHGEGNCVMGWFSQQLMRGTGSSEILLPSIQVHHHQTGISTHVGGPWKQMIGVQNEWVGTRLGALSRSRNRGGIKGLVLVPKWTFNRGYPVFKISIVVSTNVFTWLGLRAKYIVKVWQLTIFLDWVLTLTVELDFSLSWQLRLIFFLLPSLSGWVTASGG